MSETAGKRAAHVKILGIQHMIPINVTCELDGVARVVTAFVDYGSQQVMVSPEGNPDLDPEEFRMAIVDYLNNRERQMIDEMDIEVPPHDVPVADVPRVDPGPDGDDDA